MKKKEEIIEEDNKKGIIIILVAIAVVLGLIILTAVLSKETELSEKPDDQGTPVKIELKDENLSTTPKNSNVVSVANKTYVVKYLDIDGEQIGKTQKLTSLDDRVNEKAPKIDGMRFAEWIQKYDENEDVYYYIASYRQNVEAVTEDVKVTHKKAPTYTATVTPVENEETEKPTYDVDIEGEVPEVEEIPEEISISEEYARILVLRFYAPEDVTKEQIENMKVTVHATSPNETINEDQYSYNGEDTTKSGRELLDSTDEEYESGLFYFDYYQETDTKTDTTVEVYWGNDPDANETTEPKDEYVEVYNINLNNEETNEEKPVEIPLEEEPIQESNEEQVQE